MRQDGSFFNRAGHWEKVIDPGRLQEIEDSGSDPGGDEMDALSLAADEVSDDEAETAGIEVGNIGQIEDIDRSRVVRIGV